ncbi:MAG TPA: hypothetical protein VKQ36_01275 [Ktedonobacterales bacterium]|nr:hypothetical protein [Ktedonobacterales bacterium]
MRNNEQGNQPTHQEARDDEGRSGSHTLSGAAGEGYSGQAARVDDPNDPNDPGAPASSFLLAMPTGQQMAPPDTLTTWNAPIAPTAPTIGARARMHAPIHDYRPQPPLPDETEHDQRDPAGQARSTTVLPPLGEHDDTALARAFALQRASRSRRPTGAEAPEGSATPADSSAEAPGTGRALARITGSPERQVAIMRADGEGSALLIRGATHAPRALGRVVPQRRGSFTAQFIVTMLITIIITSVLTLATPLGQNAVFGDAFRAYANAIPVIPTPTPTLAPTATPAPPAAPAGGYNPGQQAVINYIEGVFGPYAQGALNVAHCESGYDPNAWNTFPIGDSHAAGVFQILYPSTWDGTAYAADSPFNYQDNIRAAYQIFSRDGYSWREWQCQP